MAVKRPSLAERMKLVQQAPMPVAAAPVPAPVSVPEQQGEGRRYFANTRVGMKRVTAVVAPEEHRRLKRLSADTGCSIEELMREALADLFAKHEA